MLLFQSWDTFFRSSAAGLSPGLAYQSPPTLGEPGRNHVPISSLVPLFGGANAGIGTTVDEKIIDDHLAVQAIIRSYQVRNPSTPFLDLRF